MMATLLAIVTGLIVALVAWLASTAFNRRRLYCVAPHVFEYSRLSKNSSVAFVQIQNAGRKSEEQVEIRLSPGFSYELLASTAAEVNIEQVGLIKLARLTPREQVGLLFLVEGTERFKRDHLIAVSSKDAQGKVVASASDIDASGPKLAGILLLLFLVSGVIANMLFTFGKEFVWPKIRDAVDPVIALDFYPACVNTYSNGEDRKGKGLTKEVLESYAKMSFEIRKVYRRGDYVYVDVRVKNLADVRSEYSVQMKSTATDSSTSSLSEPDDYVYNIIMMSEGESKDLTLGQFLPVEHQNQLFWMEYRLETDGSYWVNYDQRIYFDKEQADRCNARAGSDRT